jgi:hypothetical protein
MLPPLLFFAVVLITQSIENPAFSKLSPEQQETVTKSTPHFLWLIVPLILAVSPLMWDPLQAPDWSLWFSPLMALFICVIYYTCSIRRLLPLGLPSHYIKARLISHTVLILGFALIFLM